MDVQQFQDAMVAALGQVNLSAGIGQEFKDSLRQIGLPQVPPLVIAGTKIDTGRQCKHPTLRKRKYTWRRLL